MRIWVFAAVWGIAIRVFAGSVVLPIPVNTSSTGFVSLAVIDTNGVLVRTIAYAEPVGVGGRTFFWDGTTDLGLPAAPGTYTTRGVFFPKAPAAKYVMKVGTSGNPPWRLRDGTGDWGGDLGGPSTIAANSTSLMVAWSAVENYTLPGIQQIDTNGNVLRSYISFYPYDGRMGGAMDDTEFFLGILNRDAEQIEIARYELGTDTKTILATLPTPPHYTLSGRWKTRWESMLDGMAITTNRIFASVALDDRLFILDRASGAILQQLSLPAPRGLVVSGGRLLVVSSNTVVRMRLDGTVEATLVSGAPLSDAYAITADRAGNFYVSDGGSRRNDPEAITGNHQIHVFNSSGTYLYSIGAPGGSPRSGAINRQGFGDIRSVCIGPDGKLWVNEEITGFKRTSRWNTNGTLEREWFQRQLVHYADLVNAARPSELICPTTAFDDYSALTAYTLNWTNGTWDPAWSYAINQDDTYQEDVFLSNTHFNPLQELQPDRGYPPFHYNPRELVTYNGRNYFINQDGNGDGAIFTYTATNAPRPVAMLGYHRVDLITNRIVSYYDSGPNVWFTWADRDGNGHMAIPECTFTTNSALLALSGRMFNARLDSNLTVRLLRSTGGGQFVESFLPFKELLQNGAPVYDWALLRDAPMQQLPSFAGGDGSKQITGVDYDTVPPRAGGASYSLLDPQTDAVLDLPSLDNFWANRNWRKRIAKFDGATGKFLWASGRRAPSRTLPGEMYNPFGLTISHSTIFAADVLGMVWLWSDDGLYLGRLLNDAEPGQVWDEYAIHVEVNGPVTLFTNQAAGKLYMIVNDTGAHVYEVTLPQTQVLPSAALNFTADLAASARAWDPDGRIPIPGSVLSARRNGGLLEISWHTNAASMTLQSAGQLPPSSWANVTAVRQTNGPTVTVPVPAGPATSYFRLVQ